MLSPSSLLSQAALAAALLALAPLSAAAQAPELAADVNQSGQPYSGFTDYERSPWVELGGLTLIVARTQATGSELFSVTPGSPPVLVRDILPGTGGSAPELGPVIGGVVYFTADDGESGREIWRTDGTLQGTRRFSDVTPGIVPSSPKFLTTDGTRLFASVLDGPVGFRERRLAVFDMGTGQPTYLTKTFGADRVEDPSGAIAAGNGRFVFAGVAANKARNLYVTQAQANDAQLLQSFDGFKHDEGPSGFTAFDGYVYFSAYRSGDRELWRTDGTSAGTSFVQQIWLERVGKGNGAGELVTNGSALVFTAFAIGVGTELWRIDAGDTANPPNTTLLTDINGPGQTVTPKGLFMTGSDLYFTMRINKGHAPAEPWRATTTPFTEQVLADISTAGSSFIEEFVEHAGRVYFAASSVATGRELWSTDGTPAGTALVGDIQPGGFGSAPADLYSTSWGLLFHANESSIGRELYAVIGGTLGLYADMAPGSTPVGSDPSKLARVFATELYFAADDGFTDVEPYKLHGDGTLEALGDLHPTLSSGSQEFTGVWDGVEARVYFRASDGSFFGGTGEEVYVHDSAGTRRVTDVWSGPNGSSPNDLTAFGGELYFTARPKLDMRELFRTDSTPAGTVQITPADPVWNGNVRELVAGHEALYFLRTDSNGQRQVMRTDGQSYTTITAPLATPGIDAYPLGLRFVEGRLVYLTYEASGGLPRCFAYDEAQGTTVEWPLPIATHFVTSGSQQLVHEGRYFFTMSQGTFQNAELFSIDPRTGDLRLHHAPNIPASFSELRSVGERVYYALEIGTFNKAQRLASCTSAANSGAQVASPVVQHNGLSELTGLGDRVYFEFIDTASAELEDELLVAGPLNGAETFAVAATGAAPDPGGSGFVHGDPSDVTAAGGDLYFGFTLQDGPGRELYRLTAPEASVVDYDLPASGGELQVMPPNLGGTTAMRGFTPIAGGLTAVVLGAPAAPYALPGAVPTDAACVALGATQVVGVFATERWSTQAAVPATPSLAGTHFALQGVVADVLTPGAPLRLTNAKFLTLGL